MVFAPFLNELDKGSPTARVLPPVFRVAVAVYGISALVIREFANRLDDGPLGGGRPKCSPGRVTTWPVYQAMP